MTLSLASTVVWAIEPTDTSVTYFIASWNGSQVDYTSASTTDYTTVTDQTTGWKNGTYVVNSSVVVDSRITVSGTVNLILCDGASLNAKKGIQVNSGNTLNIYGQENGTGALTAKGDSGSNYSYGAGIGGFNAAAGTIVIHNGVINATGNRYSAGIGGADRKAGGNITIFGGKVTATGYSLAAGIGSGDWIGNKTSVTCTIYGGEINATGSSGAGIGGARCSTGGNVSIYGGSIYTRGSYHGIGLGSDYYIDQYGITNGTLRLGEDVTLYDGNTGMFLGSGPIANLEERPETMTTKAPAVTTWAALQSRLNVGGDIVLGADIKAGENDEALTVPEGVTATLNLNGKSLDRGLTEAKDAGSVLIVEGTLTVNDTVGTGKITGGYSNAGGGVYIAEDGTFTLNGGKITGNKADQGGGVYQGGTMMLSGNAEITDNTDPDGKANNVYLPGKKIVKITDALTDTALIGITMAQPGVFTNSVGEYASANNFISDDSDNYYIKETNAGELSLNNTIVVDSPTVEFDDSFDYTYTGSELKPGVTVKDGDGNVIDPGEYTVSWSDNIDAGTGTVTITDNAGGMYRVNGTATFTINRAALQLTDAQKPVAETDLVYTGDPLSLATPSTEALPEGSTEILYAIGNDNGPTGEWSSSIPEETDAGTYYVWYKLTGDDNHTDSEALCVEVTIANATLEYEAQGYAGEYDGQEHGITVSVTKPETGFAILYGTEEGKYDMDSSPLYKDAGSCDVYYEITADNYETVRDCETVDIGKKKLVVTANAAEKNYGEEDPELTYVSDGLVEGDEITGQLTRAEGQNAGTYAIDKGTLSAGDNYEMTFEPALFTINRVDAEYTAPKANELVYDGTDQVLLTAGETSDGTILYSADGEGFGEELPTGKDVGQYTVYYKVIGDENHEDTEVQPVEVAILQRSLSVTAENAEKVYGDVDPEFTYRVEGLVEGDELSGALSRMKGGSVGNYDILQGTLSAGDNYYIDYTSACLVIRPKDIGQAAVATKWKSYDYNGKERKPNVTAVLDGKTLKKDKDFKVSYRNNKKVGKASYTVTGIGNYTGSASGTFELTAVPVYRLFSRRTGEHFYTTSVAERQACISNGWNDEGVAWYAPRSSDTPIYRVMNPNNKNEHFYTKSKSEKDWLVSLGWRDEGIAWYSDDAKTVPVYRHYHPVQRTGNHHYTTSTGESDHIVKNEGWKYEGISWYAANLP